MSKKYEKETNIICGYSLKTLIRQYGIDNITEEEKEWGNLVDRHKRFGDGKGVRTFNKDFEERPTPNYTKLMEEKVPKDFQKKWIEYRNKRKKYIDVYNGREEMYYLKKNKGWMI